MNAKDVEHAAISVSFLLRLAHNLTVVARDSSPDIDVQQHREACNEPIHHITSYALALNENQQPYSAAEFVEVLESIAQTWGIEGALRWAWRTSVVGSDR